MGHDTELRHDDPPPQRCPDCTELVHAEEWEMHMADHDKQEIHEMSRFKATSASQTTMKLTGQRVRSPKEPKPASPALLRRRNGETEVLH